MEETPLQCFGPTEDHVEMLFVFVVVHIRRLSQRNSMPKWFVFGPAHCFTLLILVSADSFWREWYLMPDHIDDVVFVSCLLRW